MCKSTFSSTLEFFPSRLLDGRPYPSTNASPSQSLLSDAGVADREHVLEGSEKSVAHRWTQLRWTSKTHLNLHVVFFSERFIGFQSLFLTT